MVVFVSSSEGTSSSSKTRMILALIISLTGFCALVGFGYVLYKRRKRQNGRRDNQRTRLFMGSKVFFQVTFSRGPALVSPDLGCWVLWALVSPGLGSWVLWALVSPGLGYRVTWALVSPGLGYWVPPALNCH